MSEEYLAHHGILGQRWGIRRFQPYSTTGGRKSGKPGKEIGMAAKKTAAPSNKPKEPEKTPEEKQREFEERKTFALKNGSAADILKYKGHLTNQEMTDAINRIRNENTLKELAARDVPKVKTAEDRVNDLLRKADIAKRALNTIVEVNAAITKTKDAFDPESNKKNQQKQKDLATLSAVDLISKYGYGKLSATELDTAIKRMKKEHELEDISKGIWGKNDK